MSSQRPSGSSTAFKSLSATIKPWVQVTRVQKFAGTMVLFWPYAWSLTMAARVLNLDIPSFVFILFLGFIGSSLLHRITLVLGVSGMISSTVNLTVKLAKRTKNRPIAAGTISVPGAVAFLFVHLAVMIRMIWNLDAIAFQFGLIAIVVLPGVYPFMKRITYWPQAWLGIAMNVGAPMAWLALGQGLPPSALTLFAGSWSWTMWYDTIYACQDKRDDVKAGVKSTALLFGSWIKPILFAFASGLVASLVVAGILNDMGIYYHIISVGGGAAYLLKEMYTVNLDSPKSCWQTFHRNGFNFGALVWCGVLADYIAAM